MPEYRLMDDIVYPYMRETANEKKPSTRETDASNAKRLSEFFGVQYLSEINGAVVREYRMTRIELDGVLPVTAMRELALASKAINYAISEWDWDLSNPFMKRMISDKDRKAIQPRGVREITKDEEKALLDAARSRGGEYWDTIADILEFALKTGLRMSEVLHLNWWQLHGDVIQMTPDTQKANRHSECIMNSRALEIVAGRRGHAELVFAYQGEPLHRRKVQRAIEELREITGVQFVFSDTRKTLGQRMLNAGFAVEDVQYQLRHADKKTTQRSYLKTPHDRLRAAVGEV